MTPYEIWYDKKPNVSYFKIFGSRCYVHKDDINGKFDQKSEEGTFLGCSTGSKVFKCLIKSSNKIVESANVKIYESKERNDEGNSKEPKDYEEFVYVQPRRIATLLETITEQGDEENIQSSSDEEDHIEPTKPILAKYVRRNHAQSYIIGDKDAQVMTRNKLRENTCLISKLEPRRVKEALNNEDWMKAMTEEIEQIKKNETWTLVPRPKEKNVIGTKWIFKNKLNEKGEVI